MAMFFEKKQKNTVDNREENKLEEADKGIQYRGVGLISRKKGKNMD